jgi:hypothetical protein
METTFTLGREDFSRFQKLLAKRFRAARGIFSGLFVVRVIVWIFVGLAVSSFFRMIEQHPELTGSLRIFGAFCMLAVAAVLILPLTQQSAVRKHMLRDDGPFLNRQTVRMSEELLTIQTTAGTNELRWSAILSVDEDSHSHYLFIDALQAVVIPKAAVEPFRAEFERRLAAQKQT